LEPHFVKRITGEGAVGDEAAEGAIGGGAGGIGLDGAGGEVGEFPGFTDGGALEVLGEGSVEDGAEALAAPEAFLKHRFEFQRVHGSS
jgi:hypothetical protein